MATSVQRNDIYKNRAKHILNKLVNQVHFTLSDDQQTIQFDIESQKEAFWRKLHTTPAIDIVQACREFIEQDCKATFRWQNGAYAMPGSTLMEFRRLLKATDSDGHFSKTQIDEVFDLFAKNLHSRLERLSHPITNPNHIKPYGIDPNNPPVFLMCTPNTTPPPEATDAAAKMSFFSYAPSYVGRLYIWQMMKNAIEAAGGEVKLVDVPQNKHKERDVFVRDPLIRDTHGVIIRPEWHDGIIETEQPRVMQTIHKSTAPADAAKPVKKHNAIVKRVHASIENGNIATDHKRHLLFIGHDNEAVVTLDAAELQGKTSSRVVPLVLDERNAETFYHLDMALTELGPGQFIWCPKAFTLDSRAIIEEMIPEQDRIAVDLNTARRGACNCVTVGKTVITPCATQELKDTLHDKGYNVETSQSVGLPDGELLKFGLGAIHCATFFIGNRSDCPGLN